MQDSHVDYIYFEFFFFLYCKEIEHILRGITLSLQSGVSYAIFTPNTSILKLNFGFEKKKKKKGMHFYVVKDNKLILKIVNKKEFSFWINRTIGPRSKVWTEREMIEAAAFEFSEVKNK